MYIGDKNLPDAAQPLGVGRERERGSVLVMCLGILVVMALMATAFISSVTLQRDSARNYNHNAMAELAALSGKAHAISKASTLATEFLSGGTVDDMWKSYGLAVTTNSTFINDTYNEKSVWKSLICYDKKFGKTFATPDAVNYPYELRYAVAAIDLAGCIPLNQAVMSAANINNLCDGWATTLGTNVQGKAYSFMQIKGLANPTENKCILTLTPFSIDAKIYEDFVSSELDTKAGPTGANLKIDPTVWGATITVPTKRFYRIMIRGQLYDHAKSAAVSEVNLEFVYNLTDNCTMYQRWILDD